MNEYFFHAIGQLFHNIHNMLARSHQYPVAFKGLFRS